MGTFSRLFIIFFPKPHFWRSKQRGKWSKSIHGWPCKQRVRCQLYATENVLKTRLCLANYGQKKRCNSIKLRCFSRSARLSSFTNFISWKACTFRNALGARIKCTYSLMLLQLLHFWLRMEIICLSEIFTGLYSLYLLLPLGSTSSSTKLANLFHNPLRALRLLISWINKLAMVQIIIGQLECMHLHGTNKISRQQFMSDLRENIILNLFCLTEKSL